MTKYREVCKATRRVLRWLSDPTIITEQCWFGKCKTCTQRYIGYFMDAGQAIWVNEYCLCAQALEEELFDYGTLEVRHA